MQIIVFSLGFYCRRRYERTSERMGSYCHWLLGSGKSKSLYFSQKKKSYLISNVFHFRVSANLAFMKPSKSSMPMPWEKRMPMCTEQVCTWLPQLRPNSLLTLPSAQWKQSKFVSKQCPDSLPLSEPEHQSFSGTINKLLIVVLLLM